MRKPNNQHKSKQDKVNLHSQPSRCSSTILTNMLRDGSTLDDNNLYGHRMKQYEPLGHILIVSYSWLLIARSVFLFRFLHEQPAI